ncbi:Extended-spectrum beta-lactamase PER-1 [Chryseobacterium aquaeductus]|uniref:beta-lactamase n=1 Tax=Chryseobacterium aquaeductus TaxID=2675056 RepID=A0A9N8MIG9_9FLAO|nr:class A beta-lactamase, subclass A2 [Chryseobacterium aquaeductus]CAA7331802.1 Extended-spectrum beta-lactamase PER-1 [Chryseobacterium potabilaquae]CAD7812474.1 Extended-spectrum beta-lactamase PER-1 [Chryseobacterium aquaeductus]
MKKLSFLILLISAFTFAQQSTLDQKINSILKDKKATVGISVLGFENGFKYNKNGNKRLPLLSVFKFHIALAVLNDVDRGKLSLSQKILVKKTDLLDNTWSPFRNKYPNGNVEKSLQELLQYMVSNSDNNITDLLIRLIGGTQSVQKFMDKMKVQDFTIKADERKMHEGFEFHYWNTSTTNSLNNLLKRFYDGKIVSKNSTSFLMKTMLETTTGANKIVALLPKETKVAHRTGSSGKNDDGLTIAENDIGIITLPNGNHLALSVLVSDSMESEVTNTRMVAEIAKIVYQHFSK